MANKAERLLSDLVFAALNGNVVALDRYSGEIAWSWKSPKKSTYMTLLLDGDRLIVAGRGYLYCLDPLFGQLVWENPLKGKGMSIAALASVNGSSNSAQTQIAAAQAAAAAAAAVAAG